VRRSEPISSTVIAKRVQQTVHLFAHESEAITLFLGMLCEKPKRAIG